MTKRSREAIEPTTAEEWDKLIVKKEQMLVEQKRRSECLLIFVKNRGKVKYERARLAFLQAELDDDKHKMNIATAEVNRTKNDESIEVNGQAAINELFELTILCDIVSLKIEKKKFLATQQISQ